MTPNTGPFDLDVISDALAALCDKVGPGILVTHSQGGGPGWAAIMKSPHVKAVVSYEPGSNFPFPENEIPKPIPNSFTKFSPITANGVPMEAFKKLTRIPIIIYYGDNIPETPVESPSMDSWRSFMQMANLWAETVNKHGGDATVVHLPRIGIKGNTHFPFSDLNNIEIADHLSGWLKEKELD
jgi:hypothetical protein